MGSDLRGGGRPGPTVRPKERSGASRLMTSLSREPDPSSHRVEHRIVVPTHVPMVALLGSRDSVLRAVEDGFPGVDVHARGNEIVVSGPAGEVALVSRLLDELVEVVESGTPLTPEVVARSVQMLTAASAQRPAEVLTFNILSS